MMDETTVVNVDSGAQQELSLQEQQKVDTIIAEIDIIDPSAMLMFGAKTMTSISQFSDDILKRIRAKDAGYVGQQLTELLMKVKGIDINDFSPQKPSFISRIPVIGTLFKKGQRKIAEYETLTGQVDTIASHLEEAMISLLRETEQLEQLFLRNRESYGEMSLYLIAGRKKLQEVKSQDLPQAQKMAEQSGDAMAAQAVRDLMDRIQRFERRLHDLDISRTIAVQTAPQVRLLQSNNQTLAEKIQSSVLTTIPIWKSQIVLALAINTQRTAAQLQKDVADTTNELLRKNAEILQQSSIATAHEVERSIVDIETLREVQSRLINTIEETVNIANEARARRANVEQELAAMETDLRQRLTSIATQKSA